MVCNSSEYLQLTLTVVSQTLVLDGHTILSEFLQDEP